MSYNNIEFWNDTKSDSKYLDFDKLSSIFPNGAFFINGSQLPPDGFNKSDLLTLDKIAASKPIILEDCKANIMSQLTWIDKDVELACVRINPNGIKTATVLKCPDDQETSSKMSIPEETEKSIAIEPIDLEKLKKDMETNPEYQAHLKEMEEADKSGEKPPAVDAETLKMLQNSRSIMIEPQGDYYQQLQEFTSKSLAEMPEIRGKSQRSSVSEDMPTSAWQECYVNLKDTYGPYLWNPDPQQTASVDLKLQVGNYAINKPGQQGKYLVLTTVGGGITPTQNNKLLLDNHFQRGWFQYGFDIEYGPTKPVTGLSILKHAPENANNVKELSSTTGWSINIGGGISESGGNVSVGFEYSQSQTETVTVQDFDVENQTNAHRVRWEYRLSDLKNCAGESFDEHLMPDDGDYKNRILLDCVLAGYWSNKWPNFRLTPSPFLYWKGWWGDIKDIPTLGKRILVPKSQAIWRAGGDFKESVKFYVKTTHRLVSLVRPGDSYGRCSIAQCFYANHETYNEFTVNFDEVSNSN